MQLPREGCVKIRASGGLGELRWSLRDLLLSIEMNKKTVLTATNTIEFRNGSYHINDIPSRGIVSGISLEIPYADTLVPLGRSASRKTTRLPLLNALLAPTNCDSLPPPPPTPPPHPPRPH